MIRYPELLYQAVKVVPETFQLAAHEERELKVLITPKLVAPLEVSLMCEVKYGASRSLSVLAQVDGPKMKIVDAQVSCYLPLPLDILALLLVARARFPYLSCSRWLSALVSLVPWCVQSFPRFSCTGQASFFASANPTGLSAAGPCPDAGQGPIHNDKQQIRTTSNDIRACGSSILA